LASKGGVNPSATIRWTLDALGGRVSRARKRSPHRSRRERKAHFGELVQLDGSFHLWYEARGPRGCLMNLVDDATGQTLARLGDVETIWAAADVLRRWIDAYGVPLALYAEWKNVYVREPNAQEQATGTVPRTQLGRMSAGRIQIIAELPAGQGSRRAHHWTHQDRLGKKLRRPRSHAASANASWGHASRSTIRARTGADVGRGLSSTDTESGCARSRLSARGDARAVQRLGDSV
jgi:hypothetical protein